MKCAPVGLSSQPPQRPAVFFICAYNQVSPPPINPGQTGFMMKKIGLTIAVLVLLTMACKLTKVPPTPAALTQPTAISVTLPAQADVLFQDDFSDPNSGWDRFTFEEGDITDYADGEYRISIVTPKNDIWANPNTLTISGDVTVDVDVRQTLSAPSSTYGIICGYIDTNNFHVLSVGNDGFVEIYQYKAGEYASLYDTDANPAIHATGVNHLTATCSGQTLSLTVNGTQVASVTSPDLRVGNVGLIGSAYEQANVEFYFDNLTVTAP